MERGKPGNLEKNPRNVGENQRKKRTPYTQSRGCVVDGTLVAFMREERSRLYATVA